MKIAAGHFFFIIAIITGIMSANYCADCYADSAKKDVVKLTRLFPSETNSAVTFAESIIASSLLDLSQGKPLVIVPVSNGVIAALDSETGALDWQINVPTPENQQAQLISTPAMIGDKLVVLYQCLEKSVRTSHRLVVIDLLRKKRDASFPVLELSAEKPAADGVSTVKFNPSTAFSHSALKHAPKAGSQWGVLYAAFGNAGDTQPFHGWLFEIDLDAWQKQGLKQAISSLLLTTPEAECPITLEYGTQEMICGGGIWSPAGPSVYPAAGSVELFVPTGNGQLDLSRRDYANTLMRLRPGLQFDPECDKQLCAHFNPAQPDAGCMASCKNLFIPRPAAGDPPLKPANGECDNKTFWECLAWMDYDLGANSPVMVSLNSAHSVLVQPGKDGGVYLLDAAHLGAQHDRLQIADLCGAQTDPCKASWMGMIVTRPALAYIDNEPVVVIATFSPDKTHPAGLIAVKIVLENGRPKLRRHWQFPDPSSSEALQTFRSHPSLPVISTTAKTGEPIVWIVDIGNPGTLYGVRMKDGALLTKHVLSGTGRQLAAPLIYDNTLYLASIMPGANKAMMEAYRFE